jgi:predicted Zn-dependent peptidase
MTLRDVTRAVLDNGLRVLVVPDARSAFVTTAVHYGVGWRSEPPGRAGFAHLFEHLMFEGSGQLPKGQYAERLQSVGGSFTAFTRADYTAYWSQVPVEAFELSVWAEADRMRGPVIDQSNLDNQISVVKEEIRINVRNRPYGSFPFFDVPPALFSTYPNTHDAYGDFAELERTTLHEAQQFFDVQYHPGNALVTVTGGVTAAEAIDVVTKHFGGVPARRGAPAAPDLHEALRDEDSWTTRVDALAPLPAIGIGVRVPDPDSEWTAYLATYLLERLLTAGTESRLHERLVRRDGLAQSVVGWFGIVDQPYGTRHPSLSQIVINLASNDVNPRRVVGAVDEEIARIAEGGVTDAEMQRLVTAETVRHWTRLDDHVIRTLELGMLELIRGRAELIDEMPRQWAELGSSDLAKAASEWFLRPGRAIVVLEAGASS